MNEIIDQLRKCAEQPGLTLRDSADESLLSEVESIYNITLPNDFKELYRFSDGFETEEDMFNMMPLAEIIDNKKRHNDDPFYIAEYMLYCDMWQLEINPDNCNDYKIINISSHGNKLLLTNSLAEFITRFLKGGVFEDEGLYDWHNEIESQSIYSTNPKSIKLLLTVYHYCLVHGIISRDEVFDWADRIILSEDEPNHFFIEVSRSRDLNELISVMNSMSCLESGTSVRAVFGLMYHRVLSGAITADASIAVINKYDIKRLLTPYEAQCVYELTDEIWLGNQRVENVKLKEEVLKFLAYYTEFELTNYRYWEGINYRIEQNFIGDTQKTMNDEVDKKSGTSGQEAYNKKTATIKFKKNIGIAVLSLLAIFLMTVNYQLIANVKPITVFKIEISEVAVWQINVFGGILLVKVCYDFWNRRGGW